MFPFVSLLTCLYSNSNFIDTLPKNLFKNYTRLRATLFFQIFNLFSIYLQLLKLFVLPVVSSRFCGAPLHLLKLTTIASHILATMSPFSLKSLFASTAFNALSYLSDNCSNFFEVLSK